MYIPRIGDLLIHKEPETKLESDFPLFSYENASIYLYVGESQLSENDSPSSTYTFVLFDIYDYEPDFSLSNYPFMQMLYDDQEYIMRLLEQEIGNRVTSARLEDAIMEHVYQQDGLYFCSFSSEEIASDFNVVKSFNQVHDYMMRPIYLAQSDLNETFYHAITDHLKVLTQFPHRPQFSSLFLNDTLKNPLD